MLYYLGGRARVCRMGELAIRRNTGRGLPALIAGTGQGAAQRFRDFFTVHIRNKNTRAAYARAAAVFLR